MTELKALVGTEKQVAWAEKIRARILTEAGYVVNAPAWEIEPHLLPYRAVAEEAYARLCRQGNAGWWIDQKDRQGWALMTYFAAKTRDKWKAEGGEKAEMFRDTNPFLSHQDRQPVRVMDAHIY